MNGQNSTQHFQIYGRGKKLATIRKGKLEIPLRGSNFYCPSGDYMILQSEIKGYKWLAVIPKEVWEEGPPNVKNTSGWLTDTETKKLVNLETIIKGNKMGIMGIPLDYLEGLGFKDKSEVIIGILSGYFGLWNPKEYEKFQFEVGIEAANAGSELNII